MRAGRVKGVKVLLKPKQPLERPRFNSRHLIEFPEALPGVQCQDSALSTAVFRLISNHFEDKSLETRVSKEPKNPSSASLRGPWTLGSNPGCRPLPLFLGSSVLAAAHARGSFGLHFSGYRLCWTLDSEPPSAPWNEAHLPLTPDLGPAYPAWDRWYLF